MFIVTVNEAMLGYEIGKNIIEVFLTRAEKFKLL